jgi:hypothetical protein
MNENNQTKSASADEITYQAEIGLIFKKTLSISPDGITWKNRHYTLDGITHVRWGSVKNSVNAMPLGTDYTIAFGNTQSEAVISLRRKKVYYIFLDKLWRAVCIRLILDILNSVATGKQIEFGNAVHRLILKNDGITLVRYKFRSEAILNHCTWDQIYMKGYDGNLYIGMLNDKNSYVRLPYLGSANIHILEKIIRMVINKPEIKLLSDLIDNQ